MKRGETLELIHVRCALCGSDDSEEVASGHDFEYRTAANLFHFVGCRRCGHRYLDPRPRSEDLDVIYPPDYYAFTGTTNALVARAQRSWESGKVKLYRSCVGAGRKRLLDVGCGDGRFLRLLRDFGDPAWELVGLEQDERAIAKCRSLGFTVHSERVEDFAAQPGERGRYDAVIMLQLIEHVEDPVAICERVFSLLRPGGVFIVETPNLGGLDHRMFQRRWWGHYHFPRHWNLFSRASLVRMLEARGFEIVRSEYLISTSSWIISHQNWLKDRGWPRFLQRFTNYQNPLLLAIAVAIDAVRMRLGLETSNQRVIARRPASA